MSLINTPQITVNGYVIKPEMIDAEVQYHPAETRREAMVSAAESLVLSKLILQKAIALNLTELDEDACLGPDAEYRLLTELQVHDEQIPQATDAECQRYYEANKTRFVSSPIVAVSHILLAADPLDIKRRNQQQELAQHLLIQLQAHPADFEATAKNYSDCPSKELKGNLGQILPGQTVPEFQKAIYASKKTGLVPFVVESRFGFHIVQVNQFIEGTQLPYAVVEDKIRDYLKERVARKSLSQYLHRMVAEAEIIGFSFNTDQSSIMQ